MNTRIAIIGAGVSGLTCGVLLQENGFKTTIIAKNISPDTTSDVSAALWYPYKAEPVQQVLKWGNASIKTFLKLTKNDKSGVTIIPILELLDNTAPDPWWKDIVLNFKRAKSREIPGNYKAGYYFEAPLIEMPGYIQYLQNRYEKLGGSINKLQHRLQSFDPLFEEYNMVINCTGLGSKELLGDSMLFPIRGQVVIVEKIDINKCLLDLKAKRALTYIIPRKNDCVLGGTSEDHEWKKTLSEETQKDILKKSRELLPELKDAKVITQKVGLRPARKHGLRLEAEQTGKGKLLIHNYGHGGAGVTLSWGCAQEVLEFVKQAGF